MLSSSPISARPISATPASAFKAAWAYGSNILDLTGDDVMRKNVAGQKIGCQMVTAADGTAFTGTVTIYVTGDAGTQAIGSVGSGLCTHEGNGYHTYAPSQAETNYDLIAFTFTGTGAIPVTVQVYTTSERLRRSARAIVLGTVGAASTTTSIVTSSLDPAAAVIDQFKGRIVIFDEATTTAALRGQATDITANTALGVLTVTALSTAPASGDTFTIT